MKSEHTDEHQLTDAEKKAKIIKIKSFISDLNLDEIQEILGTPLLGVELDLVYDNGYRQDPTDVKALDIQLRGRPNESEIEIIKNRLQKLLFNALPAGMPIPIVEEPKNVYGIWKFKVPLILTSELPEIIQSSISCQFDNLRKSQIYLADFDSDVAATFAQSALKAWIEMPKYSQVSSHSSMTLFGNEPKDKAREKSEKLIEKFFMIDHNRNYYELNDNVRASEAITALRTSGHIKDCFCANNLYGYAALLDVIGADKFDALFSKPLALMGNMRLGANPRATFYLPQIQSFYSHVFSKEQQSNWGTASELLQPGDCIYMLNREDYRSGTETHYSGAHLMVASINPLEMVGLDFNTPKRGCDEIIQELKSKNAHLPNPNKDIPGYQYREHTRIDTEMVKLIQKTDATQLEKLIKEDKRFSEIRSVKENRYQSIQPQKKLEH